MMETRQLTRARNSFQLSALGLSTLRYNADWPEWARRPLWDGLWPVPGRKVRAPQDTVVGNAHRPRGPGKCHRKQTADGSFGRSGKGEMVR